MCRLPIDKLALIRGIAKKSIELVGMGEERVGGGIFFLGGGVWF